MRWGPDGKILAHNKIWRTPPGVEGGGDQGQRGLDMAPAAPHTVDRKARECTSCHATAKALGYGTHDGRYLKGYAEGIHVDIMNEKGELVTRTAQFQLSPIPDLPMDLDQVMTREGEQLQTVGQHWPLDGPLTKDMRDHMERVGVCLSCHKDVPSGRLVYRIISTVGSRLGVIPKTDPEHQKLVGRVMFVAANIEIFGTMAAGIIAFVLMLYFAPTARTRPSSVRIGYRGVESKDRKWTRGSYKKTRDGGLFSRGHFSSCRFGRNPLNTPFSG